MSQESTGRVSVKELGWNEWVYEGWKGRRREKGDYTLPQ